MPLVYDLTNLQTGFGTRLKIAMRCSYFSMMVYLLDNKTPLLMAGSRRRSSAAWIDPDS
jgi:hypothetical protein